MAKIPKEQTVKTENRNARRQSEIRKCLTEHLK